MRPEMSEGQRTELIHTSGHFAVGRARSDLHPAGNGKSLTTTSAINSEQTTTTVRHKYVPPEVNIFFCSPRFSFYTTQNKWHTSGMLLEGKEDTTCMARARRTVGTPFS